MLSAKLKHPFRVLEKASFSPARVAGRLSLEGQGAGRPSVDWACDLARGALEFEEIEALGRGLEALLSKGEAQLEKGISILRVKNRLRNPTDGGWSDVLVNFTFQDGPAAGHVCELQFVHRALMAVRSHMGAHQEYAVYRAAMELLAYRHSQDPPDRRDGSTDMQLSMGIPVRIHGQDISIRTFANEDEDRPSEEEEEAKEEDEEGDFAVKVVLPEPEGASASEATPRSGVSPRSELSSAESDGLSV